MPHVLQVKLDTFSFLGYLNKNLQTSIQHMTAVKSEQSLNTPFPKKIKRKVP